MKRNLINAAVSFLVMTINVAIGADANMHPVGSCYGGGVVFYATSASQHGLIAALDDASPSALVWDTTGATVVATQAQYFTGLTNTSAILNTSNSFPAAQAANSYVTTGSCSTCTAWYLPAQEELSTLYSQANFSGAGLWTACSGTIPSALYWSSTQVNGTNPGIIKVWTVNFSPTAAAGQVIAPPDTTAAESVRAIRAF